MIWETVGDDLEMMAETLEDVPFDDFEFMRKELEEGKTRHTVLRLTAVCLRNIQKIPKKRSGF